MLFRSSVRSRGRWQTAITLMLAVCGVFIATPAGATSGTYTNPATCSAAVQNGICIAGINVDYGDSTVTLSMTVGKATDPTTDPNWLDESLTNVSWEIGTEGSTVPTFAAEADSSFNTPGTFSGVIYSIGPLSAGEPLTELCDQTSGVVVSFDLASNEYGLTFPSSCIGSPSSLGVQAQMVYTAADSPLVIADAPGSFQTFDPCCTVTPGTTTSTTSTTTTSTTTSTSTTTTSTTTTVPSSTTTSTAPITGAGTATTTTTAPVATAGTVSSGGNSGTGSAALAFTGPGDDTPMMVVTGVALLLLGYVGRRRLSGLARRTKR